MHDFELHVPRRLEEAHALLEQYGDDARLLAGGTGLIQLMKLRLAMPPHVVALHHIPGLNTIERRDGELRIGAMVSHRQVETSPLVLEHLPLLAHAFHHVATIRIRNAATVGGSLAHADPNQDPPPAFVVLGARVLLVSPGGAREVSVEELSTDNYETVIQPNEILTQVIVPLATASGQGIFLKFLPRTADDYATVAVAVWLSLSKEGTCRQVRIALGSVGSTPVRGHKAEALLQDQVPTPERLRQAGEAVLEAVSPLDDLRGSADYKREMAAVFTRRALEQALSQGASGCASG